jgi:outer membrane protein OmpA-like peptidoglycan-associated protein
MNQYTFLDLLVSSHTDSRESDEYNIRLSNDRANAVTNYMAKHKISTDRIQIEWFGEQNLVNDCGNGKPCSEHQLNRRSELILRAFPDPSKSYDIPEEFKDLDYCDPEQIMDVMQRELGAILMINFDKSILRSVDKLELERIMVMLNRMLSLEGYIDQRGSNEYNEKLSEKRNAVVNEYLEKSGGEIPITQISTPASQRQAVATIQESEPAPAASKLTEPSKVTHSVAAGETLFSISNKYGVSVDQLKSWNNIGSQNIISVGQKLVILKP